MSRRGFGGASERHFGGKKGHRGRNRGRLNPNLIPHMRSVSGADECKLVAGRRGACVGMLAQSAAPPRPRP
eukprot:365743-Chlamydomonas_euryale.AAC.32